MIPTPSISLPASALGVLNVFSLRAFHPAPETGTLYGPVLDRSADGRLPSCRLIGDGEDAAGLKTFSLQALEEAQRFAGLCSGRGIKGPYRLPNPDRMGTPWFLDDYRGGETPDSHGRAVFRTFRPIRRVEMDLRTSPFYRYAFTIESPEARFTHAIRVGVREDVVETERFSALIRGMAFGNALKLALGLSAAVYDSGQYDPDEIGPLRFRQGELGHWVEVSRKGGRFAAPVFDPDSHAELSFVSSRSVFEDSSSGVREPVLSLRLRPASLTTWDAELSLKRPPAGDRRLMPLAGRLQEVLWGPIFNRIFTR